MFKKIKFYWFFLLVLLTFVHAWRMSGGSFLEQEYEPTIGYENEVLHLDLDVYSTIESKVTLSGEKTFRGSPYLLLFYAIPDVDKDHDEYTSKDGDALLDQTSFEGFRSAKLYDAELLRTKNGEPVQTWGEIDLLSKSKITLDRNLHVYDVNFLNRWSADDSNISNSERTVQGRIPLGPYDLDYENYAFLARMEVERDGYPPFSTDVAIAIKTKGEKSGVDSILLTEVQIATLFIVLVIYLFGLLESFLLSWALKLKRSEAIKINALSYSFMILLMYTSDLWLPQISIDTLLYILLAAVLQALLYNRSAKTKWPKVASLIFVPKLIVLWWILSS